MLHVVNTVEESDIDGNSAEELLRKQQDELKAKSNDQKFLNKIAAAHEKLGKIKTRREKLNSEKAAIVTSLVDLGLDRKAVKAAISYAETPPEKRALFDLSYTATRKALNLPMQGDLFVAQVQDAIDRQQDDLPE